MEQRDHEGGASASSYPRLGSGAGRASLPAGSYGPDSAALRGAAREEAAAVTASLERIVAGDREARAWLYDRFGARLYRGLRARYGHEKGLDAEELLQDSFLFFFQHDARVLASFLASVPPSERSSARLDGYLWGLACGIASNRRRSLRRNRTVPLSDGGLAGSPLDPEQHNMDRDTLTRLAACLRRAGSRVFLYCKFRFVDGLTPEEISQITGWSRKATYKLKLTLNDAVVRCATRLGIH